MTVSIGRINGSWGYEYLTKEVATGRHDYYEEKGEAPGQWLGQGVGRVGVWGQVDADDMAALYGSLEHPRTGEQLGRRPYRIPSIEDRINVRLELEPEATDERIMEIRREELRKGERQAVHAFDVTFSPPKSLSVLWALGDEHVRDQIWQAHHSAIDTALDHLEEHAAYSRAGGVDPSTPHGIRHVDTDGLIIARFDHRFSRSRDPQIHSHCAVLNRVWCPDPDAPDDPTAGKWRTLNGQLVYRERTALDGLYAQGIVAETMDRLGLRWHQDPDGHWEINGVPTEVNRMFSKRSAQVDREYTRLATEWAERHPDRQMTRDEEYALRDRAVYENRPNKRGSEALPAARTRIVDELAAAGYDPVRIVSDSVHLGEKGTEIPVDSRTLFGDVVEDLEQSRATWTRANVVRAVADLAGAYATSAEDRREVIEDLADQIIEGGRLIALEFADPDDDLIPDIARRKDGTNAYRTPGSTPYTTARLLQAEADVVTAATTAGVVPTLDPATVGMACREADLTGEQAKAVERFTSDARTVDVLVGPAGTGKTRSMRALVAAWEASGHPVLGLTVSQNAANVLAEDAGCRTENLTKFLFHRKNGTPDPGWELRAGQLVIIDEAGMAGTLNLAEIVAEAQTAGAKVLLVGDHLQLGAPEAGGLMRLLVAEGVGTQLTDTHRFAAEWEGPASLRLRDGDTAALDHYDRDARIRGGTLEEMLAEARHDWIDDTTIGQDSVLIVPSNQLAARLAGDCRTDLVDLGFVDDARTVELADGNRLGAGDRIVTRRNDRTNTLAGGSFVANRDQWRVIELTSWGSAVVEHTGYGGRTELSADYLAEHVELAYAGTVHAVQGRTVDIARSLVEPTDTREAFYVAMTRGRLLNTAYVVTEGVDHPEMELLDHPALDVLANIVERAGNELSATEQLREALAQVESLAVLEPIRDDAINLNRQHGITDDLDGLLPADVAAAVKNDPALRSLATIVGEAEARGWDRRALLELVIRERALGDAESIAQILHWRIERRLTGPVPDHARRTGRPQGPASAFVDALDERIRARQGELAEAIAADPPTWARPLGRPPQDPILRVHWLNRVGEVAGYRERYAVTSADSPAGDEPSTATKLRRYDQVATAAHAAQVIAAQDQSGAPVDGHRAGPVGPKP